MKQVEGWEVWPVKYPRVLPLPLALFGSCNGSGYRASLGGLVVGCVVGVQCLPCVVVFGVAQEETPEVSERVVWP